MSNERDVAGDPAAVVAALIRPASAINTLINEADVGMRTWPVSNDPVQRLRHEAYRAGDAARIADRMAELSRVDWVAVAAEARRQETEQLQAARAAWDETDAAKAGGGS